MTHRDFAYWLQGHFEITGAKTVDERSLEIIKEHMRLVVKETNTVNGGYISINPANIMVTC
jgi:hypothetical protein